MVGVLLDREPDTIGEWLADASAFDASGADALWVDCGPRPDWDVLALAAALAVVTHRARLMVTLHDIPQGIGRTVDTIGRLSRGRLLLMGDASDAGAGELWESVPVPQGRESWRAICADAAERGVSGLVVPADPRLLDILRNPDDPGERHDLQLAQG
jgi:alkanesulfonate monooxygenase SsuD/methylene tetrahydromethanopterin reductase-like flavin-dependent oxidoreductase (luciferase family)